MSANRISDPILLNEITSLLNKECNGMYVDEIFSISKNEFVLSMRYKERTFAMEAYMDENTSFIYFPERVYSGRTSMTLFGELINVKFLQCYTNNDDRSFFMEFENGYAILFKLYGRNANVILFKEDEVAALFRTQFAKDHLLHKSAFEPMMGESRKYEYFIYESGDSISLSLEKPDAAIIFQTSSAKEALEFYSKEYFYRRNFLRQKQKLLSDLNSKRAHLLASIKSAQTKMNEDGSDHDYKQQADILMANLEQIHEGAESAVLFDFYHDRQITIKLKKDVSPQKLAESYYRKSRRQELEKQNTIDKINSQSEKIKALEIEIIRAENITNSKQLKAFLKPGEAEEAHNALPFRTTTFNGYEIYIGKNATSNDELLRYAGKEDLWLHARAVSGSHVIVRKKGKNPIPKEVIEKAAEIAAWFSKGKNASLQPVVYTLRKYVRKPKGAAPGAVLCDKEEVILVEPKNN